MDQNLMMQELSDDELEMVAGGHHHSCHHHNHHHHNHHPSHHHSHSGNSHPTNIYVVNNYYIIDSSQTQITTFVTGSSNHSSNSSTSIAI
jgi:hypothetical protein